MSNNQKILTKHINAKHAGHKECWICDMNHEDTKHIDDEMFEYPKKLCESATNDI